MKNFLISTLIAFLFVRQGLAQDIEHDYIYILHVGAQDRALIDRCIIRNLTPADSALVLRLSDSVGPSCFQIGNNIDMLLRYLTIKLLRYEHFTNTGRFGTFEVRYRQSGKEHNLILPVKKANAFFKYAIELDAESKGLTYHQLAKSLKDLSIQLEPPTKKELKAYNLEN